MIGKKRAVAALIGIWAGFLAVANGIAALIVNEPVPASFVIGVLAAIASGMGLGWAYDRLGLFGAKFRKGGWVKTKPMPGRTPYEGQVRKVLQLGPWYYPEYTYEVIPNDYVAGSRGPLSAQEHELEEAEPLGPYLRIKQTHGVGR